MAEHGVPPSSIYADAARIRDRAAEQTELARPISQALHVCDMPRAQQLIEDGADLFGHSSMVAAAAQARQDELAAMDAARRDVMQSYPQGDLGDQWPGEPEPEYLDDEEWPHDEPLAEED